MAKTGVFISGPSLLSPSYYTCRTGVEKLQVSVRNRRALTTLTQRLSLRRTAYMSRGRNIYTHNFLMITSQAHMRRILSIGVHVFYGHVNPKGGLCQTPTSRASNCLQMHDTWAMTQLMHSRKFNRLWKFRGFCPAMLPRLVQSRKNDIRSLRSLQL